MKVRVKPACMGYYGEVRRREGQVFEMADTSVLPLGEDGKPLFDKKGQPKICPWVDPVNPADLNKLLAKHGIKPKAAPAAPAKPVDEPKGEGGDKVEDDAL